MVVRYGAINQNGGEKDDASENEDNAGENRISMTSGYNSFILGD